MQGKNYNVIQDFINPMSMLTPSVLAGLVATVSGIFFSVFSISAGLSQVILSFFVALIVFYSKEFDNPKMKFPAKIFFYILNALMILALSYGTNQTLGTRVIGIKLSPFLNSAYAQGTQKIFIQRRPIFQNTRKIDPYGLTNSSIIQYSSILNYTGIKKNMAESGIIVPEYSVKANLLNFKDLSKVKTVKYYLPSSLFETNEVLMTNRNTGFEINMIIWSPFILMADIKLESGEIIKESILVNPKK